MLSQLGFRLVVQRLPEVEYWCQSAIVPGVTLLALEQPTPFQAIPLPGHNLTFQTLKVDFKVDEKMANYFSIFDWMVQSGFPDNFDQFKYEDTVTDVILMILDSNERPRNEIRFEGAFPVSLSSLNFTSVDSDVQYITASVEFKYRRYFHKAVT